MKELASIIALTLRNVSDTSQSVPRQLPPCHENVVVSYVCV